MMTFQTHRTIIYSMTPEERRRPSVIDMNQKRIAKGAEEN